MTNDFENSAEFQGIIALARASDQARPPLDLTARIMAAVATQPVGRLDKLKQFLLQPRQAGLGAGRILSGNCQGPDVSICFFVASFFHLVLGLVLILGLGRLQGQYGPSSWVMAQPDIALMTAFFLCMLGFALLGGRPALLRAARGLVLIYVFVSIVNAFSLQLAVPSPLTLAGALLLTGWAAALGLFLYLPVRARLMNLGRPGQSKPHRVLAG